MLGEQILDRVGAEAAAMDRRKQRRCSAAWRCLQPALHRGADLACERRAPFLAALADASDVRAGAEGDIAAVEAGNLRKAQTRLDREEQQHMVAAADPVCSIGCGEDRVDLRARQEMDLALLGELAGYGEDALYLPAARRLLESEKAEESPYRGEPEVAGRDPDRPVYFEIVEEGDDEGGIDIGEIELRRRLPERTLGVAEQKSERVPVGCDRVLADAALVD